MLSYQKILSIFVLSVVALVGCGPTPPSRSEFTGEVITEVPEIPGADQRYPLPELGECSTKVDDSTEAGSSTK